MIELLNSFQDTLKVVLGAFIAMLGTVVARYLQDRTEKIRKREELLLTAIELTLSSVNYCRSVAYAKKAKGLEAILELETNPGLKLFSIVLVHFPTAFKKTQRMMVIIEDVHELSVNDPEFVKKFMDILFKCSVASDEVLRELNAIGQREKIGVESNLSDDPEIAAPLTPRDSQKNPPADEGNGS